MRLPGTREACGPLLELGWISRQLRLGQPVTEGIVTIRVDQVLGTVNRGRDFDACWHPTRPGLAKRLADIEAATPGALDESIGVIGVGRAYFVVDGHKRVALARRNGREFLDAQVSRLPSPYALSADAETDAILRTAREGEFRRHSGIGAAEPQVRFALLDPDDYGELAQAVEAHGFAMGEGSGRLPTREEAAADWYRSAYLPTVNETRERFGELLEVCTDADLYLLVHRQRLAYWGTECDDPRCAGHQVATLQRLGARRRGPLARLRIGGANALSEAALLLPLSDEPTHG